MSCAGPRLFCKLEREGVNASSVDILRHEDLASLSALEQRVWQTLDPPPGVHPIGMVLQKLKG